MNSETDTPECKSNEKVDMLLATTATDSEEEDAPVVRSKRRVHRISDSDEDSDVKSQRDNQNIAYFLLDTEVNLPQESNSKVLGDVNAQNTHDDDGNMNSSSHKSRLRKVSISSNSSDSNDAKSEENAKSPAKSKDEQDSRIENKRNILKDKFKTLVTKRLKKKKSGSEPNSPADDSNSDADVSPNSEDEASSINKIRQKIKEKTMQINNSICDPDTSDEEVSMAQAISKPRIERKSMKPTSPKPIRMSAKQAMENMQKIKSESNRMLREKEVSLPYHRPKALSLKDILSKRRPAVSADGKALPIKMNEEQLRQYSQQLEQRQKEVIELCKSESEDEPDEPKESEDTLETEKNPEVNRNNQEIETLNDTIYDEMSKTETSLNTKVEEGIKEINSISDDPKINNSISSEKMDVDKESLNIESLQTNGNEPQEGNIKPTSIENAFNDNDKNNSAEMELVYNDSLEETGVGDIKTSESIIENLDSVNEIPKPNTEVDSQLISLQYDNTDKTEYDCESFAQVDNIEKEAVDQDSHAISSDIVDKQLSMDDNFSDNYINMDDIDALIENAEISASHKNTNNVNSPMLIKEPDLTAKPILTGTPGMVIDLDGTDPLFPRKLTGVELLKERFVFFAKLKTPEELERDKEKTLKPGAMHFKLKQELEEQIAEQRSLEWAKRLEEEKQNKEHDSVKEIGSDGEDIDDIEATLEEKEEDCDKESSSSESEEEIIEHDIVDKPRKRNPMVDDEAEESDSDEISDDEEDRYSKNDDDDGNEADKEGNNEEDETEESSDESEEEQDHKPKKSRILKAFEDSDDEENPKIVPDETAAIKKTNPPNNVPEIRSKVLKESQDDVIQLAQKSQSEDLFTSQDSKTTKSSKVDIANTQEDSCFEDKNLGTQTFSILETSVKDNVDINLSVPDKLPMTCDSQAFDGNLDAVVGMCSGSFSQNLVPPSQMTDVSPSQVIGENVLALCTGQFYDNQFVSQHNNENSQGLPTDKADTLTFDVEMNRKDASDRNSKAMSSAKNINELNPTEKLNSNIEVESIKKPVVDSNLKSILDELNDPEFDLPKSNKYFVSNMEGKENKSSVTNAQFKKKFVIDSDDEGIEEAVSSKKIKKKKKKKMEQRALQISDDEEVDEEFEEGYEFESDLVEEGEERIVEYDSDENEVIVQPQNPKKKRKLGEFFENEAELTSEDEWIGSGDEDEAGLDRMEREEGDDETFNQNQLQRELGQIHMRDVLDQDKREVRLIQELLFEDGDLGGGSRQRKFRWKDVDGEDDTGTGADEFADTQEDEAESEEQWRKQRHERETFLRSLNNQTDTAETLNISFNRTSTIKANLSKNSSNLFVEVNTSIEKAESPAPEKKTAKDIPSPKKHFVNLKHNCQGSLLTRGRGALARLAALATPLAMDDDVPTVGSLVVTNKRNFVFAALDSTKDEDEPKVTKRKAEANVGTPRLVKKLRTEDKQKHTRTSLLDHLKV